MPHNWQHRAKKLQKRKDRMRKSGQSLISTQMALEEQNKRKNRHRERREEQLSTWYKD